MPTRVLFKKFFVKLIGNLTKSVNYKAGAIIANGQFVWREIIEIIEYQKKIN